MNGREFVDTNVLIYGFDRTAGPKREAAFALLERLWTERNGCVSLQVLQEFYVSATRRLTMPAADAALQVERFGKWILHRPDLEDIVRAIELHRKKGVSFWDALILRSADRLGCSVLWSEDLSHDQRWGDLVVRNPFAEAREPRRR